MCCAKSPQLCPALSNAMDHSPPGSSVHRVLQARILEWIATPSSRGSSRPRYRTRIFNQSFYFDYIICDDKMQEAEKKCFI